MEIDKIKKLFTWIFTTIGLVLVIVGSVEFLNLALKTYIFPKADYNYCTRPIKINGETGPGLDDSSYSQCKEQQSAQKQRDAAQALAFLITGTPIFIGFYKNTKK